MFSKYLIPDLNNSFSCSKLTYILPFYYLKN